MNREKLKEREESREKSKTISKVRERDLVSDIDELIRVSADSRGEIYFKLKLIELFNDFIAQNILSRY